jgi:hypothetical protein
MGLERKEYPSTLLALPGLNAAINGAIQTAAVNRFLRRLLNVLDLFVSSLHPFYRMSITIKMSRSSFPVVGQIAITVLGDAKII